jgi:1-deoxyxylulose-5-phosphate synthase
MQTDEKDSIRIMDRAYDLGVNFYNTAAVYENGAAEEFLGRWMATKERDQLIIGTTVRARVGAGPNDIGLSRLHIMREVERSLKRLNTDYIDFYQTHAPDSGTHIEVTIRALDDLVHQGKVRVTGCSNYHASELCKALWVSDKRNLERFEGIQNRYNLLARELEVDMFPLCEEEGVGVTVYNPLAGGMLAGKHQWDKPPAAGSRFDPGVRTTHYRNFTMADPYRDRYWHKANFDAVERLKAVAEKSGRSLVQYSLAWVLANPIVDSALVGARTIEQLEETISVVDRPLTKEEYEAGRDASLGATSPPAEGPRSDVRYESRSSSSG